MIRLSTLTSNGGSEIFVLVVVCRFCNCLPIHAVFKKAWIFASSFFVKQLQPKVTLDANVFLLIINVFRKIPSEVIDTGDNLFTVVIDIHEEPKVRKFLWQISWHCPFHMLHAAVHPSWGHIVDISIFVKFTSAYNIDAVIRTVHLLLRKHANILTKRPKIYVCCIFSFLLFLSVALYRPRRRYIALYTDNKENQFFLIYEEYQNGAVAQSYMTNSLLIHGEIFSHFLIF